LVGLEKFDEALAIAKKGADRVARNDAEYRMIESDLKDCERFVRLNAKLKEIAGGQGNDISNSERLDLARFCQYPKHDYGTAARLYEKALALEPVLGTDIGSRNLYHAAHSTILHSLDASNGLSESERSQNLKQAREWLRADLDGLAALAAKSNDDQV